MRITTLFTLALAALVLGACTDDNPTGPSIAAGPELAKGGGGKGKGKPGDRIVYTHKDGAGNTDIYTMFPDGSHVNRITFGGYHVNPRWAAGQSKIVYVGNGGGAEKIFQMNADGSGVTQLTFGTCADRNPAPSPDGTRIAFSRACDGAGIYLVNMDGSNLTQLTFNGADHQPTWMPAGDRVVFANNDGLDHGIFGVNVDGSNRATLKSCGPVGSCRAPMISPDGSRLTFWTPLNEGQIVILTLSNQGWVELAHLGSGTEYPATFSPDGTKLVFTAGPYGTDIDLYSVNAADGSGLTRLTSVTGPDAAPSWHR